MGKRNAPRGETAAREPRTQANRARIQCRKQFYHAHRVFQSRQSAPSPHPTKAGPCFAGPGPIARVIRRAPSRNDLDKSQQFKRVKRKPGARIETGRLPEAPKRPTMRARRGRGGEREGIAPPRRDPAGFDAASPLPAKLAAPRANSSLSARAPPDRLSPHEKTATEKQALRAPAPVDAIFYKGHATVS